MKRDLITKLEQIPNVGPATAGDLRLLGIENPQALVGKDPHALYLKLCKKTGARQDPCVLDVFISCVRYMEGAPRRPWWAYTKQRKRDYLELSRP